MRKGFTLIELLVVIAIIGLLSSVVLASLNTARDKARASSIEAQVLQFRTLMELEYSETGSYANLNTGWAKSTTNCATKYSGTYAANAGAICESLKNLVANPVTNGYMYTGVNEGAGFSNSDQYSIMARLPGGTFFCVGSSGGTSDTTTGGSWAGAGCYGNP